MDGVGIRSSFRPWEYGEQDQYGRNRGAETDSRQRFSCECRSHSLPRQPKAGELPPQVRMEKIAVCWAAVSFGGDGGCTAEDHLADHEFSVVLADRSGGLLKTRVR